MKRLSLYIIIVISYLLTGCGGNNNTNPTSSNKDYSGTYKGAATVGDLGSFNFSTSSPYTNATLSYTITGSVYTSASASNVILTPLGGSSDGHFWENSNGIDIFVASNIGIANDPNLSPPAKIVALRNPDDANTIMPSAGAIKKFIYIDHNRNSNTQKGCVVKFKGDKSLEYSCSDTTSGNGCWAYDPNDNKKVLASISTSSCTYSNIVSNLDFNIMLKSGIKRDALIVDHVDGSGIGVGVEKKAITTTNNNPNGDLDPSKTYEFKILQHDNLGNACIETATLSYNTNQWVYNATRAAPCSGSSSGIVELNRYYDSSGILLSTNGAVAIHNSANSINSYKNLLFDIENGYFIAIKYDGSGFRVGALTNIY